MQAYQKYFLCVHVGIWKSIQENGKLWQRGRKSILTLTSSDEKLLSIWGSWLVFIVEKASGQLQYQQWTKKYVNQECINDINVLTIITCNNCYQWACSTETVDGKKKKKKCPYGDFKRLDSVGAASLFIASATQCKHFHNPYFQE